MSRVVDIVLAATALVIGVVAGAWLTWQVITDGVKGSEHGVDPSGEPSGERAEPWQVAE